MSRAIPLVVVECCGECDACAVLDAHGFAVQLPAPACESLLIYFDETGHGYDEIVVSPAAAEVIIRERYGAAEIQIEWRDGIVTPSLCLVCDRRSGPGCGRRECVVPR